MLSAIAARKAAQAARQTQDNGVNSVEDTPPASASPVSSGEDTPPPVKPSSKRKSSSQTPRPAKKKRKEQKREREKQPRYFAEDAAVVSQEDMIIVDDDQEELLSDAEVTPPAVAVAPRAWSPSVPINDSSDEEDAPAGTAALSAVPTSPRKPPPDEEPPILSTFEPRSNENVFNLEASESAEFGLASSAEGVLVALEPAETICLLGTYSFTILRGSVKIAGVTIISSKTQHRVFAPRSAPLPIIEAASSASSVITEDTLPSRFQHLLQTQTVLVLLNELRTGAEGLGQICKTFEGVFSPTRYTTAGIVPILSHPGMHMLSYQTRDVQAFELPFTWISALSLKNLEPSPSIHFVRGPKNSGKSTFARTLLNTLLSRYQRVAYLDCDLGQSEFGPGGMVALNVVDHPIFGPAFTHPTLPTRAHFIGETSPRSSPTHYLESIQALLEFYKTDVQTPGFIPQDDDIRISEFIPLVVNTMGWNKGLGADLTSKIQDMSEPTHVYEFEPPVPQDSWIPAVSSGTLADANPIYPIPSTAKTYKLEPAPSSILATNWSAADHRAIALLSYLHATFPKPTQINGHEAQLEQLTATSWSTNNPLCARPPYELDPAQAVDRIILTGAGAEDVVPSELWRVLNGAIVGLVSCEPGAIDANVLEDLTPQPAEIPYLQGSLPPSPAMSQCLGLALIRSMAPASSYMQVLTPLPIRYLVESRILVKGEMELPIWGMLDHRGEISEVAGVDSGKVPYLQWGKGEGLGGEKRRVRRNLMRRGQA